MVSKRAVKVLGLVMLIVGLVVGLDASGIIDLDELLTASLSTVRTARGKAGIKSTSTANKIKMSILAVGIQEGNKYTWKVTLKNTGSIAWDKSWYTLRLSKSTKNPDISNLGTTKVQEVLGKKTLVLEGNYKGTYKKNDIDLRDEISREWNLEYKVGKGSWQIASCNNRVCSLKGIGSVPVGSSKTIKFRITVPENVRYKGKRIITGNAVAYVGDTYVIDYDKDTIGFTGGTSTMKFIGAGVLALAGLYLFSKGGI